MKGKKYKRSETWIKKVFEKAFGLRQPYQVIVDAEFCRELLKSKVVAKEILPIVLGGPVKIYELRRLDDQEADGVSGSVFVAKRFELRNCRHSPCKSGSDCVADLVGADNPHHYVVAVQNYELRKQLRAVVGVPLLFVSRGIVLMEEPSKATKELAHQKELDKLKPKEFELKAIAAAVADEAKTGVEEKKAKKKKGKKAPNPLSVKKAKKTKLETPAEPKAKPKRKRRPKKKPTQ